MAGSVERAKTSSRNIDGAGSHGEPNEYHGYNCGRVSGTCLVHLCETLLTWEMEQSGVNVYYGSPRRGSRRSGNHFTLRQELQNPFTRV